MADILSTLFTVGGHQAVITATNQVAAAQKNLARATINNAYGGAGTNPIAAAQALAQATKDARDVQVSQAQTFARTAAIQVAGFLAIGAAIDLTAEKLVRYGIQIMNIRALTGASASDSVRAENLFRISGVGDSQVMRDIIRMGKDAFSAQGQGALAQLGVSPGGGNGLQLFNQIADQLQNMQDGLRKTELEERLFGIRGVAAIQPLLRLTRQQRNEINALSDSFDTNMLPSIQSFQTEMGIAGQTILQDFIFPLSRSFMPIIITVSQVLGGLAKAFNTVNNALGGFLGFAVGVGAVALMFTFATAAVINMAKAMNILKGLQIAYNLALAVGDALGGNWVALAAGLAVAAGIGGYALYKGTSGGDNADPVSKNTSALKDNTAAMIRMGDSIGALSGRGVPGNLTPSDVSTIYRQGKIAAVG